MKRILSLILVIIMLVSAIPAAYAADYTSGTQVVYEAAGSESYTITVPALLNPGQSGTVTLSGTWANNRVVTVTADTTVTLTNNILSTDIKTLNIDFTDDNDVYGISEVGNNTHTQTFTQQISVANIENALFGTWSGKFNYYVETSDAPTHAQLAPGLYDENDVMLASWDELINDYGFDVETDFSSNAYRTDKTMINNYVYFDELTNGTKLIVGNVSKIGNNAMSYCNKLKVVVLPEGVVSIGTSAFQDMMSCTNVYLPESLERIENSAFWDNELLMIEIPAGIKYVSGGAFEGVEDYFYINFNGTIEQWENIYAFTTNTYNISVICNDGTTII